MKVGDLVMLSAKGRKQRKNMFANKKGLGIIVRLGDWGGFHVKWLDYNKAYYGAYRDPLHYREELRYAK